MKDNVRQGKTGTKQGTREVNYYYYCQMTIAGESQRLD